MEKLTKGALTATRQAEIEALAREVFIRERFSWQSRDGQIAPDSHVASWSFDAAEAWLDERDRRRGAE